jgi:hypothetical protein
MFSYVGVYWGIKIILGVHPWKQFWEKLVFGMVRELMITLSNAFLTKYSKILFRPTLLLG